MLITPYDQNGDLTLLKAVPNSGVFICWIAINRAATRLYTTNPGDNSVTVYDIARDPSTPVEIQKVTLNGPPRGASAQLTLDSTESFLHVVSQSAPNPPSENNGISVLRVNPYDGTLSTVKSLHSFSQISTTHNISGKRSHDLRIQAVVLAYNISHILTLNPKDFVPVEGITIIHPNSINSLRFGKSI